MSRKEDLEEHIRESNELIKEYEEKFRLSSDPKERRQARAEIAKLRGLIDEHLEEYARLCQQLGAAIPEDVAQVAASRGRKLRSPESDVVVDGEELKTPAEDAPPKAVEETGPRDEKDEAKSPLSVQKLHRQVEAGLNRGTRSSSSWRALLLQQQCFSRVWNGSAGCWYAGWTRPL